MTPGEIALRVAEIELQRAQADVIKDLIKVGIPSFVAVVASTLTVIQSVRTKKVDEKIANAEQRLKRELTEMESLQVSRESLLERKRKHLEKVATDFNHYTDQIAVYCTQVITRSEFFERGEELPQDIADKLEEYKKSSWTAYSEANRAKRILQLIGFNKTADIAIDHMRMASKFRKYVEERERRGEHPPSNELKNLFHNIRDKSSVFLDSLSSNYDSLVLTPHVR